MIAAAKTSRHAPLLPQRAVGGRARRRDDAVAHIRELVEQLGLSLGDRLPSERQLAERFGLSRGTIREALQFLAALNFVEIRHGGGCFVLLAASDSRGLRRSWVDWVATHRGRVLEILEVRLGCEMFAARLAARRAGPKALAKLVEALRVMKAAESAHDVPALVQSDLAFHAALMEAAGNKTLQELVSSLGEQLIPERAAVADLEGRAALSLAEHCAIYQAVQAGDAQAASLAMQHHLEGVRRDVLVHLLGDSDLPVAEPAARGETNSAHATETEERS
jgi:GntR family transcriptional repressor for pyruvate dehydrogenase complex